MCNFCNVVRKASAAAKSPAGFTPDEMVDIFVEMAPSDGIDISPLFEKSDVTKAIKWLFTNGFVAVLIGHTYNPNNHQANQYLNGPALNESKQLASPFGVLPPGVEEITSESIRELFNVLFPGLNLTEEEMIELGTGDFDESVAKLTEKFGEVRKNNGTSGFPDASLN